MNKLGYVVLIVTGDVGETITSPQFVTEDESVAKRWVSRFNHIVSVRHELNKAYHDMYRWYNKPKPLWYDFISKWQPEAEYKQVELRL